MVLKKKKNFVFFMQHFLRVGYTHKGPEAINLGVFTFLWRTRSFTSLVNNLRDRWPTVAPPMRDSLGEGARLDSLPPLPPCDSALMGVAAYGFVFFIYENLFSSSR